MKISEFATDKAVDVLCEISAYALNILSDEELRGTLNAQVDAEKPQTIGERYAVGAQKIGQWIPLLLKKHRDDVFSVLASVNGVTIDTIRGQNIIKTMIQIKEVVKDKDLMDFFKSCAPEATE